MVQTGQCEVYARITDYSNVSGEAEHYLQVELSVVPQVRVDGKFIHDRIVKVYFDETGYASISLFKGLKVLISIPTVKVNTYLTVPDQDTYDVGELLT